MERKEVRRGLGYLPRDILLVGNAGFSFLEEVPERGSSEMESSIARRTFQSCDTDYQTRRRLPVLEARGISRSPSRGEGRGGWNDDDRYQ